MNQLIGLVQTGVDAQSVVYSYDPNGSRIAQVQTVGTDSVLTRYGYDQENRLVRAEQGAAGTQTKYITIAPLVPQANGELGPGDESQGAVKAYYFTGAAPTVYENAYDYRTRRISRTEGATTTRVVFSGGTSVRDMCGGVGSILYSLRGGDASFTHYNNRGDVITKTDDTGDPTYQAAYEAFGTPASRKMAPPQIVRKLI